MLESNNDKYVIFIRPEPSKGISLFAFELTQEHIDCGRYKDFKIIKLNKSIQITDFTYEYWKRNKFIY